MALYRSPLTVTLWPSSFLKKYGPMIPPAHKAHQTVSFSGSVDKWSEKPYSTQSFRQGKEFGVRRKQLFPKLHASIGTMAQTLKGSYLGKLPLWSTDPLYHCRDFRYGPKPSFHDFGHNFKLQEQLSGGSVVVVHEEPHPQMTGTLSYRPEETGGTQRKSLHTRHRRVLPWPEENGALFARCPVRCVPLTPPIGEAVLCGAGNTGIGETMNGDEYSLQMRADCFFSSHTHQERRRSRNHPSNIIERDRYGGRHSSRLGIMLGSRTDLHIFDAGSVNGTRYCNEILLPYVRLFRGAMGLQFLFMDDNAPCHRTVAAEQLLESEDIERMDWPARAPDLNPIEHVWGFLSRRLAARTLSPVTIRRF
ncbi:transposable element Tcb2 transposase [Trichonephila clavipes]|nr:transposable element Tcb2 transposase [Trichonephila clavipes]